LLVQGLSFADSAVYLDPSLDVRVLAVAAIVTMATTLVIGLVPAMRSTRPALMDAMKARVGAGEQRSGFRAGKWIVAGQIALSLLLLVSGGLLLRTFVNLARLDLGFDRSQLLVLSARQPWYAADLSKLAAADKPAVYDEIARRLAAVPGVTSVARAYTTPIGDDNWVTSLQFDRPGAPTGDDASVHLNFVSGAYFSTMRISFLSGRDFSRSDTRSSQRVAIVNETLARRFFPGGRALGERFRVGRDTETTEIVGVVRDAKYESVRQPVPATAFIPETQMPEGEVAEEFVLRTGVPPASIVPTVRRVATDVSPDTTVTASTLEQRIAADLARERLIATLAGLFALAGLALAMVGLYGAMSYLVTERQAEFGIRMAIGAPPASVLRLVMRDVAIVLAAGLLAGVMAVLPGTRLLEQLLFGLEPGDAATMALAAGVLAAVVLLAGYLPARRATRIDPVVALRSE
jgi:predicted permease